MVGWDGGLAIHAVPKGAICGGTGEGLCFKGTRIVFLLATMKLPITTW